MRALTVPVLLALVLAACGSESSSTTPGLTAATSVPGGLSDTTEQGSATTAPPATSASTPTSTTAGTSPPTTANGVDPVGDVCDPYWDAALAVSQRETDDALRRLSIAVALPSPGELLAAIDVLRGRSSELSVDAASEALDFYFLGFCGEPPSSGEGRFEVLNVQGVLLAGPDGVRLLDGSELVPADPVGTYFASYGDSQGGTTSLLEIRGLEIIEHQPGTEAVPRDLLLGEDIWLHDVADIDGKIVAVVTVWESDEFGEPEQHLDLVPVDASASRRIAQVGGIEFGAATISYAQGLFLVTDVNDGGGLLRVFDLSGEEFQPDWLPGPLFGFGANFVGPYQFARFAPDGETFAYLRLSPGVGAGGVDVLRTDVVVHRVSDGVELLSVEIGGLDDRFTSLDYDGHWVVTAGRDGLVIVDTWASEGPRLSGMSLSNIEGVSLLESGLNYGP